MPEAKTQGDNGFLSRFLQWFSAVVLVLSLLVQVYIASFNAEHQKELEAIKNQFALAKLTYSYTNGVFEIINAGKAEATNVEIRIFSDIDIDYFFLRPGLPPFLPSIDSNRSPGRDLVFKMDRFAPGDNLSLKLAKKQNASESPSRTDMDFQITCTNCIGPGTEE